VVKVFIFKQLVANYVARLWGLVIKKWLKVAIFMLLNLIENFSQKFHKFFTNFSHIIINNKKNLKLLQKTIFFT